MGSGIEVSPDMDPKDALAHYGVPGMQWGKRKADDSGGSSSGGSTKKKRDIPSSDEVKDARKNIRRQAEDIQSAAKAVKKNTARGSAERVLGNEKVAQMKVDLLNNPDRVTAMYLTRGEKAIVGVSALLSTPAGAAGIAGGLVGRRAVANNIAKKQRTGAYNK